MLKTIAKDVLSVIPPEYRFAPVYWYVKRFIERAQWWDRDAIERWQVARLRRIVEYAYRNVPGYRALYSKERIRPADIRSLRDGRALPFVTKELIRDNLKEFTSRSIPRFRLRYVTTGGSTGIPFGFYQTGASTRIERAFMHSGWERAGWNAGDTSAVLRGAFVGNERTHWKYRRYERELLLSSYFLTEASYSRYDEILRSHAPRHLQAYPSALAILADMVARFGKRFPDPAVLLLGSENLYDWQKRVFATVFPRSRIFAWYGHAEQVLLAPMCERSAQYHVWPYYGWAEILDESGAEVPRSATGELVGTSFWNRATPFIRYRTMDMAVRGAPGCDACGRNFQLLERIDGRLQEMIVTRGGRLISMAAINMHDDVFDSLKQFQFQQDEPGRVLFRYVPKRPLPAQELERIRQRLAPKLGPDMELALAPIDEIPRTRSGKYRFLDQKLPLKFGDR